MNFSGDVIVVYVSQTSLGGDGAEQDSAFGSPVQEEANETAQFFQSCPRSPADSVSHSALQNETLPVQEVMVEWPPGQADVAVAVYLSVQWFPPPIMIVFHAARLSTQSSWMLHPVTSRINYKLQENLT